LRIILLIISFTFLYSFAGVKYIPSTQKLYIYVKSTKKPLKYDLPNLTIDNGYIEFIRKFNYFHNGYYFVGEVYKIYAKNFKIKPLIIYYNGQEYITKPYSYKEKVEEPYIYLFFHKQKSHFFKIIELYIFLYIVALFFIYFIKKRRIIDELGDDIKKFYYYLLINNFSEVEELNKKRNLFKKKISDVSEIYEKVLYKLLQKQKFFREIVFWSIVLIIVLIIEVKI